MSEFLQKLYFFVLNPSGLCLLYAALKSGRILLEAAPLYLDLAKVKQDLLAVCVLR